MQKKIRTIQDVKIKNKIVIVRCDLDVKIEKGEVKNDSKIKAIIPTLNYLIKENAKIIVISHLGNPQGKYDDEFSLMPVRFELGRLLQKQIKFANIAHCENSIKFMEFGDVLLLENIMFSPEEVSQDTKIRKNFIKTLAEVSQLYVFDFLGLDEKYASTYELPKMLDTVAGLALKAEIESLDMLKEKTKSPTIAIFGGDNLSSIIDDLINITSSFDKILIGGNIAYTFLQSLGVEVGKSKVENRLGNKIKQFIREAKKNKCEIVLPIDHLTAKNENDKQVNITKGNKIPKTEIGLDIGPKTIDLFKEKIVGAKTIFWYGVLGKYNTKKFEKGTLEIAETLTLHTSAESFKVIAGDDTILATTHFKIKSKRFNHISNNNKLVLDYLAGMKLSIIDFLLQKK